MTEKREVNKFNFKFENTYIDLPNSFYSEIDLSPVIRPELIVFNKSLGNSLGLNSEELKSKEGLEILAGNKKVENGEYIAQAYGGHQFGHFNMLGDGRALLIGEQKTNELLNITGKPSDKFDIQLKGSGRTPYSRGGDGRAVLGPMLREYIISEAMYNLGIPTTRSLAVIKTNEKVYREYVKKGAILTRVTTSHLRFGTFEYSANFLEKDSVKKLADYAIDRHYSHIKNNKDKYLNLLEEIVKTHASLVAKWMGVGFIHGVMNTDNMTISGETIDYGPCAFMDTYNPDTVFSSIDVYGRYAYKNQPKMLGWNLCRFAESLLPLLDEDKNEAINIAQEAISDYDEIYYNNWISIMRSKLGIFNKEELDKAIIEDLLSMMEKYNEDYTNTFVSLTTKNNMDKGMFISDEFKNWYDSWQERLKRQPNSSEEVNKLMKESNPYVIPRNHRVEEAIEAADKGDLSVMMKLLNVLSRPYDYSNDQDDYTTLPKPSSCPYKTYCGT